MKNLDDSFTQGCMCWRMGHVQVLGPSGFGLGGPAPEQTQEIDGQIDNQLSYGLDLNRYYRHQSFVVLGRKQFLLAGVGQVFGTVHLPCYRCLWHDLLHRCHLSWVHWESLFEQ